MAEERADERHADQEDTIAPALEDLLPLAAVIGAGCEPCAERMVERALRHEDARPLVARTLAILGGVSGSRCFADAMGPEAVDRMKRSLRAGRTALEKARTEDAQCCG
jgi:hypothetical protein